MRVSQRFRKHAYEWQGANPWGVGTKIWCTHDRNCMTMDASCAYDIPPPKYNMRSHGNVSEYHPHSHTIDLLKFHQNPILITHEVAHAISWKKLGVRGHDKPWLGIWQWLLVKEKVMAKKFLQASMNAYKLPWCPLSPTALGIK